MSSKKKPLYLVWQKISLDLLMRWFLFLLFWWTVYISKAQVYENFEDQNLKDNPTWIGDISKFKLVNGQLNSNSLIVNDVYYISTPSQMIVNTQWDFEVKFNFNTSSLNYIDVFLASDSSNLKGSNNAYIVRIGGTNDEISLFKKTELGMETLIDGRDKICNYSSNHFIVRVIYDSLNNFHLWHDSTGTGNNFINAGEKHSPKIFNSEYFGILIKQSTSSFFEKHFFDNIYIGKILRDTLGPKLTEVKTMGKDSFYLEFDEVISSSSLNNQNLTFQETGMIINRISFSLMDEKTILCTLNKPLESEKNYSVKVSGFKDINENQMDDTLILLKWSPEYLPQKYDVLISEFMADPDPALGLPAEEFIELYNQSGHSLNLENCFIGDAGGGGFLPKFILQNDDYLLLCKSGNEALLSPFGDCLEIKGFPSLNNSEDEIIFRNAQGHLIHQVKYNLQSYGNNFKANGGWSIEMIDPNSPCLETNYSASIHFLGGTPGKENSIKGNNPDKKQPQILKVKMVNPYHIQIQFDKAMDSLSCTNTAHYAFPEINISQIKYSNKFVTILLSDSLLKGKLYPFYLQNISDCSGLILRDTSLRIGIPFTPVDGEILISEILFNPPSGGSDYIEIYNASSRILSLKNCKLGQIAEDGALENILTIDSLDEILLPGGFRVLSDNVQWVKDYYKNCNDLSLREYSFLPSMNDDKGHIKLLNPYGEKLDELEYDESQHWVLLSDQNGVSLERISYAVSSNVFSNFTSAAASYGFGTPGMPNSHQMDVSEKKNWLQVEPEFITPNEDGDRDIASVRVNISCPDCQAKILIFDAKGYPIRTLVNNESIGNEQTWFWDGIDENGRKVDIGIYIVYAEVYGLDRKVQGRKGMVTVGR